MADFHDDIDDLLRQARSLPYGPTRTSLCEEAVAIADRHRDTQTGYEARHQLVDAATFSGEPDKSLVAYSWLLAQYDRHPGRFDTYELLWRYKWVIGSLPSFPEISRRQIEDALVDMEKRYEAYGATKHAILSARRGVYWSMKDRPAALDAHRRMNRSRKDVLSDCPACRVDNDVGFSIFLGQYKQALDKAQPILRGELTCATVPQRTYSGLLRPLLRLKRWNEAMECHIVGYRMICHCGERFVDDIADHIEFLARTDNSDQAGRLMQKHLHLAFTTSSPRWRFEMFASAKLYFERLQDQGRSTVKLRLCRQFPLFAEDNRYDVAEAASWFSGQAAELAERFDKRNGNDGFRNRIQDLETVREQIMPIPYPGRGKSGAPAKRKPPRKK